MSRRKEDLPVYPPGSKVLGLGSQDDLHACRRCATGSPVAKRQAGRDVENLYSQAETVRRGRLVRRCRCGGGR